MFKLTKLHQNSTSQVRAGRSELGDTLYLFEPMSKYDENKIRKIDKDIASLVGLLKENECVMIYGNGFDFLKTSPIQKIEEETDIKVIFESETSVYKLELIND